MTTIKNRIFTLEQSDVWFNTESRIVLGAFSSFEKAMIALEEEGEHLETFKRIACSEWFSEWVSEELELGYRIRTIILDEIDAF